MKFSIYFSFGILTSIIIADAITFYITSSPHCAYIAFAVMALIILVAILDKAYSD